MKKEIEKIDAKLNVLFVLAKNARKIKRSDLSELLEEIKINVIKIKDLLDAAAKEQANKE